MSFCRRASGRLALATILIAVGALAGLRAQSPSVDDLVAKYLQAKGGADKLHGVMTVRTSGRIKGPAGEVPMRVWAKRPNMMRRETTVNGQTLVVGFDGKDVWAVNPAMSPTPRQITGPLADMTRQDADDFDSVLLDYKQKGTKVELVGPEQINGLATHHLRVTKKNGRTQDMYLNAQTLLELRIAMEVELMQGRKGIAALEFSNYKPVDGIMVPFNVRQTEDGRVRAEVLYEQVEFNVPVDETLFKMPGTAK